MIMIYEICYNNTDLFNQDKKLKQDSPASGYF